MKNLQISTQATVDTVCIAAMQGQREIAGQQNGQLMEILNSKRASKQASKHASKRRASKQASKQASKRASERASKQANQPTN
jgi:hypothetical protein